MNWCRSDRRLPALFVGRNGFWKRRPMAIRAAKDLVARGLDAESLEETYRKQKTYPAVKALYESEDRIEGPRAFAEKRSLNGKGDETLYGSPTEN